LDLSALEPGQALFSKRIVVTAADAASYLTAVEDDAALYAAERLVPPMAVAALVMGAAMEAVALPSGAVHTGQELEFAAPVREGTELACGATVAQNSVRRGTRFLVLEIHGERGGVTAVAGRTSIAIAESSKDADATAS
jgi:acyl dehydratase